MAGLVISTPTLQLLESQVLAGYQVKRTAKPVGPGVWLIEVDDDVSKHIEKCRFSGESDDSVVERLVSSAIGGVH